MADVTWHRIEPTTVTKVGWRTVVSKTFIQPDGRSQQYDTVDAEGTSYVGIIALTLENKVVIARQFRPGPECLMEEIPGGGVDPGEDLMEAAKRELLEETGYQTGTISLLGSASREAYNNAAGHYYVAMNCTRTSAQQLEATEFAEVVEISIAQLIANAKDGRMTDSHAVLLAYDTLMQLMEESPS